MDYLVSRIAFCLILAFLLGVVIGWLMRRFSSQAAESGRGRNQENIASLMSQQSEEEQHVFQEQINAQTEARQAADEKLLDMSAEMDLMKGRVEHLRREKERQAQQIENLSKEKQALKEEAFSLTADIKMLKKRMAKEIEELTARLQQGPREKPALRGSNEAPSSRGDAAGQAPDGRQKDMERENAELKRQCAHIEEKLRQLEHERHTLEQRLKAAEEELTSLRAEGAVGASVAGAMTPAEAKRQRSDYPVDEIEGIGKGFKRRLQSLGISTTRQLLEKGGTREGRAGIAKGVKIQEFVVGNWVSMADLLRIPGVDGQFAKLLLASGIHSAADLSRQQADTLTRTLEEVNKREHRTPVTPTEQMVASWIRACRV